MLQGTRYKKVPINAVFAYGSNISILNGIYLAIQLVHKLSFDANVSNQAEWRNGSDAGPITQRSVDRNHALL
jgi:hypothetical protein